MDVSFWNAGQKGATLEATWISRSMRSNSASRWMGASWSPQVSRQRDREPEARRRWEAGRPEGTRLDGGVTVAPGGVNLPQWASKWASNLAEHPGRPTAIRDFGRELG